MPDAMTIQGILEFIDEKRVRATNRYNAGLMTVEDYNSYMVYLDTKEAEITEMQNNELTGDAKIIDFFVGGIGDTIADLITGVGDIGTGAMSGFKSLGWIIPFLLVMVILIPIILPLVLKR